MKNYFSTRLSRTRITELQQINNFGNALIPYLKIFFFAKIQNIHVANNIIQWKDIFF